MQFTIRPIRTGDAQGLNVLRRMPGVFEGILAVPSERVAANEAFIAGMDANMHSFVAVTTDDAGSERLIGNVGLAVSPAPRRRHAGSIGIMVHRDYQGQGVGAALMEAALDIADNWLKLVRVELDVYTDNEHAIRLYKKYGFEEEGVKRCEAIRAGVYVDALMMARIRL